MKKVSQRMRRSMIKDLSLRAGNILNKFKLKYAKIIMELARYAVVSVAALAVDVGILIVLKSAVGMNEVFAATISFTFGLIVNFIMSRKWAFKESSRVKNKYGEFMIFTIIGIAGLLLNGGIIYAGSLIGLYYLISKAISVAIVFFWNFFLRKILLYSGEEKLLPTDKRGNDK